MTKKILQLIALALAGYIVFELYARWRSGQDEMPGLPEVRPMGRTGGAALTGRGEGAVALTAGSGGSSVSERVGRGVVRRGKGSSSGT